MSRVALIVGVNTYQYLPKLKAPAVDAEAIAKRLERDGDFQVIRLPEDFIGTEVKQPQVSGSRSLRRSELEAALEQLFRPNSTQAPTTALFYFSGHGIADTDKYFRGFLATSDTNPKAARSSGLPLGWLHNLLSESGIQQQIVWLDCCHSGALIHVGAANPGHGQSRDRCFIASSRDYQESFEDLNSAHSVFTKALLEGLDPTRLPEPWIDTASLVLYIHQALKGELQSPVCTYFGEPINLTRAWQVQAEQNPAFQIDREICPYKGLEYFDCNDEDPKYFFGRGALVSQLLDRVRTQKFLALVGASGNGKSSVLRAGLLHQLKLGRRIAGSEQWRIRITNPDQAPMENLAMAFVDVGLSELDRADAFGRSLALLQEGGAGLRKLVQISTAPKVILVIDQFEEVFTRCTDLEEQQQYIDCLMGALAAENNKLCLIIAMRADFVGKCLERVYSGLAEKIQANLISVLPMGLNDLRDSICQPAKQVGLEVEATLVTEILNDIQEAPGQLPLLQYTLKVLWQQRQKNKLILRAYQKMGGVNGSLDQRATEIYNNFDQAEQKTVQHIFLQLTQLGEGATDTRRQVRQADLVANPQHSEARIKQVIDRLSNPENRLLVTGEIPDKEDFKTRIAVVDVAHEALIRHWKLLHQWIEQNRDLLRNQRAIEASANLC